MTEVTSDYAKNHDFTRVTTLQEKNISIFQNNSRKKLRSFNIQPWKNGKLAKKYGGNVQWLKDSSCHVLYDKIERAKKYTREKYSGQ